MGSRAARMKMKMKMTKEEYQKSKPVKPGQQTVSIVDRRHVYVLVV